MVHLKYHEANLLRGDAIRASLKNYQFLATKMEEIKPQVKRQVYRKLKTWSAKKELLDQLRTTQKQPNEGIQEYVEALEKRSTANIQKKLKRMNEQLTEIRKVYVEKKEIENKISNYPFKEKYRKKSVGIKELLWEKREKEDKLKELCGTSHPFTKKGKAEVSFPLNDEIVRTVNENTERILVSKNSLWSRNQKPDYNYVKETDNYTDYVKNYKFTKITDESLKENPLVRCINNKNPKLVPFEKEFALMAHTYQEIYTNCMKNDRELLSFPEARSKIQKHILTYFTEKIDRHSIYDPDSNRWKWVRNSLTNEYRRSFNDKNYIDELHHFVKNERANYTELKEATLHFLQQKRNLNSS